MIKLGVYFFAFLVFLLLFFCSGVIDTQDGFQYLAVGRNIYYKHAPIAPSSDEYKNRLNIPLSTYQGVNGNYYSPTGLGYSLAFLPAVAITDQVYKHFNIAPPRYFPIESDWIIQFLGSFINTFFGALLGVVMLFYFRRIGLSLKQSFVMAFITLFCTNLFTYTKDALAHMMFVSFLMLTFYLIKAYSDTKKSVLLFAAGVSYGVAAITYNQTSFLSLPVLLLYYLLLNPLKFDAPSLKALVKNISLVFLGILPFIVTYIWFENVRASQASTNLSTPSFYSSYLIGKIKQLPVGVFFEGLYGQLLSPGRSIFLYSPLLLVILIFWNKLKKSRVKPELISFLLMAAIYVFFYSIQYSVGKPDQGIAGFWHGESSWGPRYLLPLIPLGMLVVGWIYTKLTQKEKWFVFYPLLLVGLYVEILGVVMPNQIKFHNMIRESHVNGTEYTSYVYINLLPRYSPLITMSKNLIKLPRNIALTLNHGLYNVRFYDGIDSPFDVGSLRWRVVDKVGHISFDSSNKNPVKSITLSLGNQVIEESSSSAKVSFEINGNRTGEISYLLKPGGDRLVKLYPPKSFLSEKQNDLVINTTFDDPNVYQKHQQIIVLKNFYINDQLVNLEALDSPYVYSFGTQMSGRKYQTYGNLVSDPWKVWDLHTQIYERTLDFWWSKFIFYYWDVPKSFFIFSLILDLLGISFFGYKALERLKEIG